MAVEQSKLHGQQPTSGEAEVQSEPTPVEQWHAAIDSVVVSFTAGVAEQMGTPDKAGELITRTLDADRGIHRWRVADELQVEGRRVERSVGLWLYPELRSKGFGGVVGVSSGAVILDSDSGKPQQGFGAEGPLLIAYQGTLATPPDQTEAVLGRVRGFLPQAWAESLNVAQTLPTTIRARRTAMRRQG